MSIVLNPIEEIQLQSGQYGENLNKRLTSIDQNFQQIVTNSFLKGDPGDSIEVETVELGGENNPQFYRSCNDGGPIDFLAEIKSAIQSLGQDNSEGWDKGLRGLNIQVLYVIEKTAEGDKNILKSIFPFTYLDPRFIDLKEASGSSYKNLIDHSCSISMIVGDNGVEFKAYQNSPTIFWNDDEKKFCWKINGNQTDIICQGPAGKDGNPSSTYVAYIEDPTQSELEGLSKVLCVLGWRIAENGDYTYGQILPKEYEQYGIKLDTNLCIICFPAKYRSEPSTEGEFYEGEPPTPRYERIVVNGQSRCYISTIVKVEDSKTPGVYDYYVHSGSEDLNVLQMTVDTDLRSMLQGIGGTSQDSLKGIFIPTRLSILAPQSDALSGHMMWASGRNLNISHMRDVEDTDLPDRSDKTTLNVDYAKTNIAKELEVGQNITIQKDIKLWGDLVFQNGGNEIQWKHSTIKEDSDDLIVEGSNLELNSNGSTSISSGAIQLDSNSVYVGDISVQKHDTSTSISSTNKNLSVNVKNVDTQAVDLQTTAASIKYTSTSSGKQKDVSPLAFGVSYSSRATGEYPEDDAIDEKLTQELSAKVSIPDDSSDITLDYIGFDKGLTLQKAIKRNLYVDYTWPNDVPFGSTFLGETREDITPEITELAIYSVDSRGERPTSILEAKDFQGEELNKLTSDSLNQIIKKKVNDVGLLDDDSVIITITWTVGVGGGGTYKTYQGRDDEWGQPGPLEYVYPKSYNIYLRDPVEFSGAVGYKTKVVYQSDLELGHQKDDDETDKSLISLGADLVEITPKDKSSKTKYRFHHEYGLQKWYPDLIRTGMLAEGAWVPMDGVICRGYVRMKMQNENWIEDGTSLFWPDPWWKDLLSLDVYVGKDGTGTYGALIKIGDSIAITNGNWRVRLNPISNSGRNLTVGLEGSVNNGTHSCQYKYPRTENSSITFFVAKEPSSGTDPLGFEFEIYVLPPSQS